jgi:hypothetical protein
MVNRSTRRPPGHVPDGFVVAAVAVTSLLCFVAVLLGLS